MAEEAYVLMKDIASHYIHLDTDAHDANCESHQPKVIARNAIQEKLAAASSMHDNSNNSNNRKPSPSTDEKPRETKQQMEIPA